MAIPSESPTRLEILRKTPLFKSLTETQMGELAANSRVALAEKGDVIWLHGSQVEYFGIVGAGFVKMTRLAPGGHEITTEIMGPGHVFGLLGTIDGSGCPQAAKAVTPVWYLKVRKASFLPMYGQMPILKESLLQKTSLRLRQSFDMIGHLTAGTVEQRVAAVLLLLADSFGEDGEMGIELNVPLTRQDIGEIAGTTVESTIRTMSKWQKAGLIETRAKVITLCDPDALTAIVRGDPTAKYDGDHNLCDRF